VKPGLNDSRAAARALSARNAVTFECVHSLDACREKLAEISTPLARVTPLTTQEAYRMPMRPQPPALQGTVDREHVDLGCEYARFRGRWVQDASGARLVGHVERSGRVIHVLLLFVAPVALLTLVGLAAAADASWEGPKLFFLILPAVIAFVGVPLVTMGLGSARAASEIELVRTIGQAIGDPGKYAVQWRRWREEG